MVRKTNGNGNQRRYPVDIADYIEGTWFDAGRGVHVMLDYTGLEGRHGKPRWQWTVRILPDQCPHCGEGLCQPDPDNAEVCPDCEQRVAQEWTDDAFEGWGHDVTMLRDFFGFLGACMEGRAYARREGRESDNGDLFPADMMDALDVAGLTEDDVSLLSMEPEEEPCGDDGDDMPDGDEDGLKIPSEDQP